MDTRLPSYVRLYETGELQQRAQEAMAWLTCCALCAQGCKVNRLEGNLVFVARKICGGCKLWPALRGRDGVGGYPWFRDHLLC